ncbi:hypothetical protein INT44_006432 [Umbelopsis vinacea]|uniref:Uncharacterized protein n=1 Tax=Umbelopsis vinacea TaxID=44442 RepID=A0A8H7UE31_9FUNG|nr:hypothetical protein INT44_006432 [Umbelopsis vinacea]
METRLGTWYKINSVTDIGKRFHIALKRHYEMSFGAQQAKQSHGSRSSGASIQIKISTLGNEYGFTLKLIVTWTNSIKLVKQEQTDRLALTAASAFRTLVQINNMN